MVPERASEGPGPVEPAAPWWRRDLRLPAVPPADALAGLALAVVVMLLFREALFARRVFFERDIHLQWLAQVESMVRAAADRAWPLWDSSAGFGRPLWANPNNQVLYPPTWLNLLLPAGRYYTFYVAGHVLFSAIGVYLLGRRLKLSQGASFVAASISTTSGPLLSFVNLWNHLAGVAWAPWVLCAADAALETPSRRRIAWCGAAFALQILTGSPEAVLISQALVTGILAWRLITRPARARTLSVMLATWAIGLALSAGQWVPSLELAHSTARFNLKASERTFWSLHPLSLIGIVWPFFPENLPPGAGLSGSLSEGREPLLKSLFLGTGALALVGAGLASTRRNLVLALGAAGAGAVVLALGRYTPAHTAAEWLFPPLRMLRFPSKLMFLAALSWSLLAGLGFDAWRGNLPLSPRRWRLLAIGPVGILAITATMGGFLLRGLSPEFEAPARRLALGGSTAAAVLLLAARRERGIPRVGTSLLVATIAIAELGITHRALNPTAPQEILTLRPPTLAQVPTDRRSRLFVYDYLHFSTGPRYLGRAVPYLVTSAPPGITGVEAQALALRLYLFPPIAGAFGVLGSFDRDLLGLEPMEASRLSGFRNYLEGTASHLRLLQIGAVSRVLALHREGFEDLTLIARAPSLFPEPIHIFAVPDSLNRFYAVGAARIADGDDGLQTLILEDFDPRKEIVLPSGPVLGDRGRAGEVYLRSETADRIDLEANLDRRGYVVAVDAFRSWWEARVDGRPAPLLRANVAFRAVEVTAGRHLVEMRYRPPGVRVGLAITLAGALGTALLVVGRRIPPLSSWIPGTR